MLVENSNRRTFPVDRHAGVAVAGLAADGRAVVDRAQSEAQQYKGFYGHRIPGHVLAERLASYVHVFNLYWYVRPMGVTSLLGVYDEEGPALYAVDPAGTVHRYYGTAVGKGRQAARNEIEKLRPGELTVREGVRAVAQILHRVHDEEKPFEAELAWVCEESGRTFQRVPQANGSDGPRSAQELVDEAERLAKEALEAEDMDD
ncbi:hypothetical protein APUTEX25_004532 [Auxenochlorella protothecoides]|uniref:Proteasome subunit alpha type-3 n=1 Tax=Auxenochlorella protothecoides TaxID=3075 RepID=A0A3M7L023_AUXPR|nr:hypothetical protein APUTEX25_004532 [Auxenochlorella protothecoides]|eukprot:RMZ56108.1 hypothetical protein APUTEX25_004532 [Auxenochlorella protothecoides]